MTNYSYPGVTVNNIPAPVTISASSIPGQPVAAFAANYNVGPTVPTLITSWQQFNQLYGGFKSGSSSNLPFAVYQYFTNGGTGCFVYRVPNSDAVQASLEIAGATGIDAPIAPTVTTATTGGTVAAGTYQVVVTYTNDDGETTPSLATSIVTTGSTSTITVDSPAAETGASGWNVYITQAGGASTTATLQNTTPEAIGTNFVLTAPPTTSGATPPTTNTAASDTSVLTITALNPGAWGSNIYVTLQPTNTSTGMTSFNLTVYSGGPSSVNIVESWNGISLNPASPRYAPSMINSTTAGSAYIKLSGYASPATYQAGPSDPYAITSPIALGTAAGPSLPAIISGTPGIDGTTPIDLYQALSATSTAATPWHQGSLAQLQDQMLNLNLPDSSSGTTINYDLINNTVNWAEQNGYVFVVVDSAFQGGNASSQAVATAMAAMTNGTAGQIVDASTVAAIYGPWLSITDPSSSTSGATRWVPPGGAVLGAWCQNDIKYNSAQTPAGVQATVEAQAVEAYFNPTDLGNLELAQINPIKAVNAYGLCIFGGLTTSPGYPNRYINISRAVMKIAHDLDYLTAFAVFQNNTPTLWQNITTSITNYLTQEMQDGLLAGNTPTNSFQVVCDDTVNTPATIAAGIVNVQVAVAVAAPAEFIIINLSQMASGSTTTISS